eukprot:3790256-Rhodomonas_salina.2
MVPSREGLVEVSLDNYKEMSAKTNSRLFAIKRRLVQPRPQPPLSPNLLPCLVQRLLWLSVCEGESERERE